MNDQRYIRHHQLKGFGPDAQAKLKQHSVLIVGMGGLGLPVAQYLNAMGIGALGLVDQDKVETHNLQRQVLYSENDVGKPKVDICRQKLGEQNSETKILVFDTHLVRDNALKIIEDFDLVVDATDNFSTRYLINDACILLNKPFVYGALHGFEGQVSVFNHQNGPTYRCLFPKMPKFHEIPDCNANGVLGVLPGIIGTFQALEAVKVITGVGEVLSGKLLLYDGLTQSTRKIGFTENPENKRPKKLEASYEMDFCTPDSELTAEIFISITEHTDIQLIDVRTEPEYSQHHLANARHIPLDELLGRLQEIDFERPVYLVCQSGIRSKKALLQLHQSHPEAALYHVKGGMKQILAV